MKMTRFKGGKWRAVVWRRCQNVTCAIRFLARADAPGLFCSNRCNNGHQKRKEDEWEIDCGR